MPKLNQGGGSGQVPGKGLVPNAESFNRKAHDREHTGGGRILRWSSISAPGISSSGEEYTMARTGLVEWHISTVDNENAPADITVDLVLDGNVVDTITLNSGSRVSKIQPIHKSWAINQPLVISITNAGGLVGRLAARIKLVAL